MSSKNAWKTFESTGSVQDYLTYKHQSTGLRKENTDANDHHGASCFAQPKPARRTGFFPFSHLNMALSAP